MSCNVFRPYDWARWVCLKMLGKNMKKHRFIWVKTAYFKITVKYPSVCWPTQHKFGQNHITFMVVSCHIFMLFNHNHYILMISSYRTVTIYKAIFLVDIHHVAFWLVQAKCIYIYIQYIHIPRISSLVILSWYVHCTPGTQKHLGKVPFWKKVPFSIRRENCYVGGRILFGGRRPVSGTHVRCMLRSHVGFSKFLAPQLLRWRCARSCGHPWTSWALLETSWPLLQQATPVCAIRSSHPDDLPALGDKYRCLL